MMIEHFLIANGSSIDKEKNSVSIFEILEDLNIQAHGLPINVPVQVVSILKREITDHGDCKQNFTLEVIGPDGSKTFEQEFQFVIAAPHRRTRVRINMPFTIARSGAYRFLLHPTGNDKGQRELEVIAQVAMVPMPPPTQTPGGVH